MKLFVKKLGRIADAEIEIAPLTVFVGPNNSNKTWTAYCLYALARFLSYNSASEVSRTPKNLVVLPPDLQSNITKAAASAFALLTSPSADPSIVDPSGRYASMMRAGVRLEKRFEIKRQEILGELKQPLLIRLSCEGIANLLAVQSQDVPDAEAVLEVSMSEFRQDGQFDTLQIGINNQGTEVEAIHFDAQGEPCYGDMAFAPSPERGGRESLLRLCNEHVRLAALALMRNVVPFPAERKALTSLYLFLQESLSSLIRPAADYVALLRSAANMAQFHPNHHGPLVALTEMLEARILGGKLVFNGKEATKTLRFVPTNGRPLGMHASASLVRALAGIDLYLNQLGFPGDLILIDEPEMNAHSEAQIAIAELLTLLANQGVKVVVTTHSPYIVDHLINLTEASQVPQGNLEPILKKLALGTADAFLKADALSVYYFRPDGRVHKAFGQGVESTDLSTFGNASERIDNLYTTILRATTDR